jgi:hypothetical protein
MPKQRSRVNPADKVGLNPQPLPPRWLPSWMGQLLRRMKILRR